jgi:Holliday junction DNA helicase RuvA
MIITLTGKVAAKLDDSAVIETGGIGYQVFLGGPSLLALRVGSETRLWTHEHVREDGRELFGFLTQGEHRLFRRLVALSGVGPRMALSLLALGSAKQVEDAVERGDIVFLTAAVGVGRKTAQKIVLELKGRLVTAEKIDESEEVLAALVNLGYPRDRAREALSRILADGSVEDRLRAALRELGR